MTQGISNLDEFLLYSLSDTTNRRLQDLLGIVAYREIDLWLINNWDWVSQISTVDGFTLMVNSQYRYILPQPCNNMSAVLSLLVATNGFYAIWGVN